MPGGSEQARASTMPGHRLRRLKHDCSTPPRHATAAVGAAAAPWRLGTAASQPQRRTAGRADLAATPGAAADGSVAQSQTKQHDAAVSGVGW